MKRALIACVLGWLPIAPALGEEPLETRVQALLADLAGDDTERRAKAVVAFRDLGPAAVPHTIGALGALQEEDRAGFLEAFRAVGVDESLALVLAHRSAWPPGDFQVRRLEAFLDELRALRAPGVTWRVRLEPARFDAWPRVPTWAETQVGTELPASLAGGLHVVERGPSHLAVDTKGDGRPDTKVRTRKGRRIEIGPMDARRPLLVYDKLDTWYAASGSVVSGRHKRTQVQVLDVDLDGRFDGETDAVRWEDGAFVRYRPGSLVRTRLGLLRYRLEQGPEGVTVLAAEEPQPSCADPALRESLAWLNAWRNDAGLPALLLDLPHSADCRLHCDYWKKHGYSGHEEIAGLAGYTEAGAHAGAQAIVWGEPSMLALLEWADPTVLHRIALVGGLPIGMAGAEGPGALVWTERPRTAELGGPILVPSPGQEDVPHSCNRENPPPDRDLNFYRSERGYPIAVYYMGAEHTLEDGTVEVFQLGRKPKPVAGEVFTPKAPYTRALPTNYHAIHFVPDMLLAARQRYAVRVRATFRGAPEQVLVWTFETK